MLSLETDLEKVIEDIFYLMKNYTIYTLFIFCRKMKIVARDFFFLRSVFIYHSNKPWVAFTGVKNSNPGKFVVKYGYYRYVMIVFSI